jgi:branched-chain amino acid transport system substrate-binding protein
MLRQGCVFGVLISQGESALTPLASLERGAAVIHLRVTTPRQTRLPIGVTVGFPYLGIERAKKGFANMNRAKTIMQLLSKWFLVGGLTLSCILNFAQAENSATIKVGAVLSLSGGLEQWCRYIRQGIELAASASSDIKIELTFEDDRSVDKKSAATAAHKLLNVDKVDLLYSWTASLVPVLVPMAENARTPLFIGAFDRRVAAGGAYVFGGFVNYDLVPREIARFFVLKRGVTKLALIMAADDWAQNFEKPFREEAAALGATILFVETVSPEEQNFSSLLLRLKREKCCAVLAPVYGGSLYAFLKQAREMRFPGLIHVGDGMFEEDLKVAGESAEGVYASQIWLESKELATAVRNRFGETLNPLQLGIVASGYDWVAHLQGAGRKIVSEGKPISRDVLREALATYRSHGYLGEQMYGAPPAKSGEENVVVRNGRYFRSGITQ